MKKNNTPNTSWDFYLDQVNTYAWRAEVFSKEECEKIIKIAKDTGMEEATTHDGKKDIRVSNVSWLYPIEDLDWAYRKITDTVLHLNERYFKFDISGFNEGFQFTNYKAPSGNYGKHVDRAHNFVIRKLSLSVQLSDPKDYEGGDLRLYESDKAKVMQKEQGTLVLFPSFILHEVMPVTKGERNSLVAWVTGKQFK
jgi:PKHD-type hydroxylase